MVRSLMRLWPVIELCPAHAYDCGKIGRCRWRSLGHEVAREGTIVFPSLSLLLLFLLSNRWPKEKTSVIVGSLKELQSSQRKAV